MVSFKVGIDGNTSRCLRHQEHTRHYGMVATFERHLYRLGQGESRTLIVVNANLHGYSRILAVHKDIVKSHSSLRLGELFQCGFKHHSRRGVHRLVGIHTVSIGHKSHVVEHHLVILDIYGSCWGIII